MRKVNDDSGFAAFTERYGAYLEPFGVIGRAAIVQILYKMAHDVCGNAADANAAALRNIVLFAAEHHGSLLDATTDHLTDPMSRLEAWRIHGGSNQERWMHVLNLRQLKNWHAKGLGNYSSQICKYTKLVKKRFSSQEIRSLDLLQVHKGWPEFGQRAQVVLMAIVMGLGAIASIAADWWG